MRSVALAVLVVGVLVGAAGKVEARTPEEEARELFREGVARFQKGDYVSALERYEQAYAKWQSPKILLNIGTTLKQLGRNAEALTTYEKYLKDPGADPARRGEVEKVMAELKPKIARLRIEVQAPGARIIVDGDVVGRSPATVIVSVDPGKHLVMAEKGPDDVTENVVVAAGEDKKVVLALKVAGAPTPTPTPAPAPASASAPDPAPGPDPVIPPDEPTPEISSTTTAPRMRRFGAILRTDVDGKLRGAVVAVGATMTFAGGLVEVSAAGLVGQHPGGWVGADFLWPKGKLRAIVTTGVPVYFIDGPRVAAHGALGARWEATSRLAITLEAGVEYFFDVPANYDTLVFVPSLGARFLL